LLFMATQMDLTEIRFAIPGLACRMGLLFGALSRNLAEQGQA
jgi:hypothetical protein